MNNARTFKLMEDAGKYAAEFSGNWRFKDEDEIYDSSFMIFSCSENDAAQGLDPDDDDSYYIVSSEGVIGLTEDNGQSVDWLYFPA